MLSDPSRRARCTSSAAMRCFWRPVSSSLRRRPRPPSPITSGTQRKLTTSITIYWDASAGASGYTLYLDFNKVDTTSGTSYTFTGLPCGTPHHLGVDAYNSVGTQSTTGTVLVATSDCPPADTSPPSEPTHIGYSTRTTTTISLYWDPSTDNVGVAGYTLYLDFNEVGTTTSTTYTFTGLPCGTPHHLGVDAYDTAGNHSATGTVLVGTTNC